MIVIWFNIYFGVDDLKNISQCRKMLNAYKKQEICYWSNSI